MGYRHGGRSKGTPNRKTQTLIEKCEEKGIDVFEEMLDALQQEPDPKHRFEMCKEIAQYIYPKRKAIEHSTDQEKGFVLRIEDYTTKAK